MAERRRHPNVVRLYPGDPRARDPEIAARLRADPVDPGWWPAPCPKCHKRTIQNRLDRQRPRIEFMCGRPKCGWRKVWTLATFEEHCRRAEAAGLVYPPLAD
jgi:hypothetical protein